MSCCGLGVSGWVGGWEAETIQEGMEPILTKASG